MAQLHYIRQLAIRLPKLIYVIDVLVSYIAVILIGERTSNCAHLSKLVDLFLHNEEDFAALPLSLLEHLIVFLELSNRVLPIAREHLQLEIEVLHCFVCVCHEFL